MTYKVKLEPLAIEDIQEAMDWYNTQKRNLGKQFFKKLEEYFEILKISPFFQLRYDDVHCLPIKKFPFMIHYTINEKTQTVVIRAIFNTHRNPKLWKKRS